MVPNDWNKKIDRHYFPVLPYSRIPAFPHDVGWLSGLKFGFILKPFSHIATIALLLFYHSSLFSQSLQNNLQTARAWFSTTYHMESVVDWDKVVSKEEFGKPCYVLELKPEYGLIKVDNALEDNIIDTSKISGKRKLVILHTGTEFEAFWILFKPTLSYVETYSIAGLQDLEYDKTKLKSLGYSGWVLLEHLDNEIPYHGFVFDNGNFTGVLKKSDNFNSEQVTERMCVDIYFMVPGFNAVWVGLGQSSTGYSYEVVLKHYAFTYCWDEDSYFDDLLDFQGWGSGNTYAEQVARVRAMLDALISKLMYQNQNPPYVSEPTDPEPLNCNCQMQSFQDETYIMVPPDLNAEIYTTIKLYNINCNVPSVLGFISAYLEPGSPSQSFTLSSANEQVNIGDYKPLISPECGHWVRVDAEEDYTVQLSNLAGVNFFSKTYHIERSLQLTLK